jgi:lipid II:glycine glycyltransferase (peptidoglycan interpeptide bridge formation enzyme)
MRAGFRHDVRRLERNGYRVVIDPWERLDEFVAVYEQTMLRHAASSYYFFPAKYYQELRDQLGEHVHLALVLAPGGEELACGSLIFEEGGILEYHLSGSDQRFLQDGPTKLLLQYLRDWGKARGNRWFNLGGGVGAQADSLFNFKKGFSRLRSSYTSFRMIVDPAAYGELACWKHGSTERKLLERRRYFPGYRRPQEREAS